MMDEKDFGLWPPFIVYNLFLKTDEPHVVARGLDLSNITGL